MPRGSPACSPIAGAHRAERRGARAAAAARVTCRRFPWTPLDCDADDALDAAVDAAARRGADVVADRAARRLARRATRASHDHALRRRAAARGRCSSASARACRRTLNAALDDGARHLRARDYEAALARARSRDRFARRVACAASTRSSRRRRPARRRAGSTATGDPSCCTLWSLLGFPAITLPCGARGGRACRSGCSSPRRQVPTTVAVGGGVVRGAAAVSRAR